jgi:hypothetical protein
METVVSITLQPLYFYGRILNTHWIGLSLGTEAGFGTAVKKKLISLQGIGHRSTVVY